MTPEEQKVWDDFLIWREKRLAQSERMNETVLSAQQVKNEVAKARKLAEHYDFIGIKAYHQLGNISRDFSYTDISKELESKDAIVEQMFHASKETDKYYIGMWYTGFGYFDVLFPKETSRPLTENELKLCPEFHTQINSQPAVKTVVNTPKTQ